MRGRKNTGARQKLWAKQRKRYQRRLERVEKSGKKHHAYGAPGFAPAGRRPKLVLANYPVKQHSIRSKVKYPTSWPIEGGGGFYFLILTGGGPHDPPHYHSSIRLRQNPVPGGANPKVPIYGKQRRKMLALGHKVFRLRGLDFFRAAARRYWYQNGGAGWPSWDPDGRTPVFP